MPVAKRRSARPKGPKHNTQPEDRATSPIDIESNSSLPADATAKLRPKPRPKPAKKPIAATLSTPDVVDDLVVPRQRTKRGRSATDTDGTVPASIVQPPAKKKKKIQLHLYNVMVR